MSDYRDFFNLTRTKYNQMVAEMEALKARVAELEGNHPHENVRRRWKEIQASYGKGTSSRFKAAIRQATQRGHEWAIEPEVYESLVTQPCYRCGGPTGTATGLDRQNSRLGYTVDNVKPCCGPCNMGRQRSSDR